MIQVALKGLLGRKLRTVLTAIAIVLGVAMICGTFILTDSIDQAFNTIFTDIRKGSNAVVSGKSAFDVSGSDASLTPSFDESLLPKVEALPSVAAAEPSVDGQAQLIGSDGKAIVFGGAPNLGFSIANGNSQFNPLVLLDGSWPKTDEVVVDKETASKEDLATGQTIGVQGEGQVQRLRISGIVQFSSGLTIGGATLAGFDLSTAQRLFNKQGRLDEIAVAAKPNVTDAELVKDIEPVLPPGTQVKTSQEQAAADAEDTNAFISFLRGFLLAFGGIALFVGSFVIANSLSITIAQRTREFATLRTIGASNRQVLGSVLIEALVVGAVASVVGLFLGLLLAKGLFKLFDAVGFTLPNSGLVFELRTVVIALAVGILVTVLASVYPGFKATMVPPIAAVREGATLPGEPLDSVRGVWAAVVVIGLGVAATVLGVSVTPVNTLVSVLIAALGLILVLFGCALLPSRSLGAIVSCALGFAALVYGLFAPDLGTTSVLLWMGVGVLLIFFGVARVTTRLIPRLSAFMSPIARWSVCVLLVLFWPFFTLPYWLLRYGAWGPSSEPTEAAPSAAPGQEDVLGRRIGAAMIDLVLLIGLFVVLAVAIGENTAEGGSVSLSLTGLGAALYVALVLLYYFALEATIGQTLGKLLLGLRVVRADGSRPSVAATALRTVLRIVDWLPFLYLVGFITMMVTGQRRQRLGDLAAKTGVARTQRGRAVLGWARALAFVGGALINPLILLIVLVMWLRKAVTRWEPEWPAEFPGVIPDKTTTRIGGENARRNPQRTASTAGALMIGLALVALVATLASGIVQTFRGAVNDLWKGSDSDYAITAQNNFSPIPIAAAEAAAKTPGVEAVMNVRTGEALVFGKAIFVTAVDPTARENIALTWKEGSQDVLANLGKNGAFVDNGYADDHGLEIGSPVEMTFPNGTKAVYEVKGIFDPPTGGSPFGSVTISTAAWDEHVPNPQNLYSFVAMKGDVTDANTAALERTLDGFPNAKVQTREQFIDNQISGLSSVLNILYVLLALSIVVSIFGIVNTLVLTVFERTREIGMLRAIGMTRRQIRRMVRHESVITALIGAAIGIVLGVVLAALLIARVDFIDFVFPTTQIIVFVIAAIIVGVLAAIFPARRAAKLDPLEAISYE